VRSRDELVDVVDILRRCGGHHLLYFRRSSIEQIPA
jgi:hypothetical protein